MKWPNLTNHTLKLFIKRRSFSSLFQLAKRKKDHHHIEKARTLDRLRHGLQCFAVSDALVCRWIFSIPFFLQFSHSNEPAIYLDIYQHVSSFYRQHIFVPVLPKKLLEYVTYVHATFLRTRQSPWVETVSELKQWQAAWAKRTLKRKSQAKFVPFDSPWERPASTQGLCLVHVFLESEECWLGKINILRKTPILGGFYPPPPCLT